MVRPRQLDEFPAAAQRAETLGFDGITLLELTVPPTLSAVACAMSITNLHILTGVFVAFPCSPMSTAYDAWSIQALKGRFQLGLGSQIKSHLSAAGAPRCSPSFPGCASTSNRCAPFGTAETARDLTTKASTTTST